MSGVAENSRVNEGGARELRLLLRSRCRREELIFFWCRCYFKICNVRRFQGIRREPLPTRAEVYYSCQHVVFDAEHSTHHLAGTAFDLSHPKQLHQFERREDF